MPGEIPISRVQDQAASAASVATRENTGERARAKINQCQESHPVPGDHAQQTADVESSSANHRVQPVTLLDREVTTVHSVICREVTDDRFNRRAPLEQLSLVLTHPLLPLSLKACA
jgi:hypothetical protein